MTISPSICVATHHASVQELLSDPEFLSLANRDGFLIELRLDFFNDLTEASLDQALKVFAPNVVATFRHPDEGGKLPGVSDSERLHYLQRAANHGVRFIDIEERTPHVGFNKRDAKLILSYHDFEKAPDEHEIKNILRRMSRTDADIYKIAVFPKTIFETRSILSAMHSDEFTKPLLLLAMGEAGLWTRVLAGKFGAPFTFARGENAPGTAPGQLTWHQLDELYRFREIKPDWPVYGVIGNPIGHSLSPLMHNTALKALNLPGVYLPFKVEGDPVAFVQDFAPLGLRGLSVTIPHKESVIPACSTLNHVARSIGAINTLDIDAGGNCAGSNTDAAAAADSLESALVSLNGKHVLIIGAGGAARAVAFGVKERGATVSVLNRTRERAEALAKEVGATAITFENLPTLKIDAIVNTTPLGMSPNVHTTPLEESQIPQYGLVFDTVYNPLRTRLLDLAEKRGSKTVEGLSMFVGQGVRQFQLWTGKTAPRELMHQVVLAELKKRQAAH